MKLFDMHCHLDFMNDEGIGEILRQASGRGIAALSVTVTPQGYERARRLLTPPSLCMDAGQCEGLGEQEHQASDLRSDENLGLSKNRGTQAYQASTPTIRVGVGLHPWWVPADAKQALAMADALAEHLASTRFVGEVGLDFAPRRKNTASSQVAALERILDAVAQGGGGAVVSLHAVRSADVVLDLLEARRITYTNLCIFHWFSGTAQERVRAERLGCAFSVGARMLATKQGRAHARAIPATRLFLETDQPASEGSTYTAQAWETDLRTTLTTLAALREQDEDELAATLTTSSAHTLGKSISTVG